MILFSKLDFRSMKILIHLCVCTIILLNIQDFFFIFIIIVIDMIGDECIDVFMLLFAFVREM